MIAVLFEAEANDAQAYFRIAAELRPLLEQIDGFISIERFESLSTPGKVLSLSFWRDEEAIARWRALPSHRSAQAQGRAHIFKQYRLRIAMVTRDYGMRERAQAPPDSRAVHD
ncbi:MAG: antibiotic biosynthesis monooxygenase [Hyphomonadaceae bacterium]|nr:antibiotic biosynthesis monooxygenase [Hyphomonadaceae bacterium]